MNPLLYVSRPKLEIKENKEIKIENKLINQLDELYQSGRKVLCEVKTTKGIFEGFVKKENQMIRLLSNEIDTLLSYADILEINVLKILKK